MKHFVLTLLGLLSFCLAIRAEVYSGECGDNGNNLTWTLDTETGKLVISGNGDITQNPWIDYRNYIRSVDIQEGVTSIVKDAFSNCSNLTKIELPNSITDIGDRTFYECSALSNITIPNTITTIGVAVFAKCTAITEVSIPNSVTSIGKSAFNGCSSLISITMPNSITSIGSNAFYGCAALTNINIPNGITCIPDYAFYGCSALTNINLPINITEIGYYAFGKCSALTNITIPCKLTKIGTYAFYYCRNLKTVINLSNLLITKGSNSQGNIAEYADKVINAPNGFIDGNFVWTETDGIKTLSGYFGDVDELTLPTTKHGECYNIGDRVFQECLTLKRVTIPNCVTLIGNFAFYGCSSLTNITIPSTVTSIGNYAFDGCSQLCDLFITNIKSWCRVQFGNSSSNPLYHAKNLYLNGELVIGLTIPEGVTSINNYAFYGYNSLESIIIPKSVLSIGHSAFYGCKNLTDISCESENPPSIVSNASSASFNVDKSLCMLYVPETSIQSYRSADGWQEFSNILPLKEIIASGMCGEKLTWEFTNYGELLIDGSGDMYNYLISSDIPWYEYREEIKEVTINEGVTSIGDYAFMNCMFGSVLIPSSISSIGKNAFNNCSNLTKITCKAVIPPTCSNTAFNNTEKSIPIYVPGASLDNYNNSDCWSDFTNINAIIIDSGSCGSNLTWKLTDHGVLTIEGSGSLSVSLLSAPWPKSSVKHIVICDGVTYIDEQAFTEYNDLKSVIIPRSVKTIDYGAFSYCYNMESIILSDGITKINDFAFYRCNKLTSIVIPKSVTYIGEYAFSSPNLNSIIVEEGNTVYNSGNGSNAIIQGGTLITGCTTTVIPNSVVEIGKGAFYSCQGLTSINIPDNVAYIEADAFQDCRNLSSLTIGAGLERIREFAFAGCTNLASITCYAVTPPSCSNEIHIFNSVDKSIPVYVPKASVDDYKNASTWNEFWNIKELPGSITINQYGCGTYCSEFALDFSGVKGLKAYAATGYNSKTGVITLTRIMTAKAGMGLFIKGEPGEYSVPALKETDDNSLNMLVGTLEKTTVNSISDDGKYYNYRYTTKTGDPAPSFYKIADGYEFSAGKAYLQIPMAWRPEASEARNIILKFDDGNTTDIEEANSTPVETTYYDLMGRKVKNPQKDAIYIVNGKKTMLK